MSLCKPCSLRTLEAPAVPKSVFAMSLLRTARECLPAKCSQVSRLAKSKCQPRLQIQLQRLAGCSKVLCFCQLQPPPSPTPVAIVAAAVPSSAYFEFWQLADYLEQLQQRSKQQVSSLRTMALKLRRPAAKPRNAHTSSWRTRTTASLSCNRNMVNF